MTSDDRATAAAEVTDAAAVYLAIGRIIRALRRVDKDSMSAGLVSALGAIAQVGPMRMRDLAAIEGVTAPTMSRIVAGLEADGYLFRTVDPTDARAAVIDLTPTGRDLINGVKSDRVRHLAQALDNLPAPERAALVTGLSQIARELRSSPAAT